MGDQDPEVQDPDAADPDIECDLLEVAGLALDRLTTAPDSALVLAIRRVRLAAENPDEAAFTFQQSI